MKLIEETDFCIIRGEKYFLSAARVIVCFSSLIFFSFSIFVKNAYSEDCFIATAHTLATKAGCDVLSAGGNAFDAAVAVTAVLGVVEPYSSGFGGGGFYLLHEANTGRHIFIDARETAPEASAEDLYLDAQGNAVAARSRVGALATAIPGIPAALDHISRKYAKLSLSQNLEPAILLAQDGFDADSRFVRAVSWVEKRLRMFPSTSAVFLNGNKPFELGQRIRQRNLGKTLEKISERGVSSFYSGEIARELVQFVNANGGNWSMDDLSSYKVVEREPVVIEFSQSKIFTAPLPSSGGLVMAEVFNILESLRYDQHEGVSRTHLIIEAMRRAYNDRARFMGDPDFSEIPSEVLMSRDYAKLRASTISEKATPSSTLPTVFDLNVDGEETTHFSIVDAEGNKVAATLSINGPFGAGMIAGDTGIILNNHMDDFSIGVGSGNAYELVGNRTNGIQGGKRPLSSMSPTIVEDEKGYLVIGTPGGSRIISMVLLSVLDYLSTSELNLDHVVGLPRYHHQYLPDRVQVEPESFDKTWIHDLESRGHEVQIYHRKWGNMQAVHCEKALKKCTVANDPRGRAGVVF